MKQKIQIALLPTEEGRLVQMNNTKDLHYCNVIKTLLQCISCNHTAQHVYVTVSNEIEPIKDGDWYIYNGELLRQFHKKYNPSAVLIKKNRKIIATTDHKLISPICSKCNGTGNRYSGKPLMGNCIKCSGRGVIINNIPQVQQSFIKEYVANPKGEWEVEYESTYEYTFKGQI